LCQDRVWYRTVVNMAVSVWLQEMSVCCLSSSQVFKKHRAPIKAVLLFTSFTAPVKFICTDPGYYVYISFFLPSGLFPSIFICIFATLNVLLLLLLLLLRQLACNVSKSFLFYRWIHYIFITLKLKFALKFTLKLLLHISV